MKCFIAANFYIMPDMVTPNRAMLCQRICGGCETIERARDVLQALEAGDRSYDPHRTDYEYVVNYSIVGIKDYDNG